jgi:Ser/Thr protein kinase RdoA (MazF antagonist)
MVVLEDLAYRGEIPFRITHNDTKADNILFDQAGKAISVIDLDTVMPGLVHYDFGDALRSLANPLAEDSDQFDQIRFDLESFTWFAKGFLIQVRPLLTKLERETLALSVPVFPYLMGLRFLTDYLEGNVYYKTSFPEHNLVRSQNQMRLLESIESNLLKIENIIRRLLVT